MSSKTTLEIVEQWVNEHDPPRCASCDAEEFVLDVIDSTAAGSSYRVKDWPLLWRERELQRRLEKTRSIEERYLRLGVHGNETGDTP